MTKRILVFPCGSEIGLEIHRSMKYSAHFDLIGGSSADDHGRFVYENYLGDMPFHDAPGFIEQIAQTVRTHEIEAIYPTMDAVAETLQSHATELCTRVIGSDARATAICASKRSTHALLSGDIPLPMLYPSPDTIDSYPVFIKPDRGYGARHCMRADSAEAVHACLSAAGSRQMLLQEFLPGREWTVDCFSDRHGALRFHGVRERQRISNGISVRTTPSDDFAETFGHWARTINRLLRPRGAWFFQARADAAGEPRLLETAARLGGSSGLFRCRGINFALLSAFDAFDQDVEITPGAHAVELDRALDNRYRVEASYSTVFVDFDDCLVVRGRLNHELIAFLYKSLSNAKRLVLMTRHAGDLDAALQRLRLAALFDTVIHITDGSPKSDHVSTTDAIFIDDSFHERTEVARKHGIPVFAPDMVECLV